MAKVGGGDDIVVAQGGDHLGDAGVILVGGDIALALKIIERRHAQPVNGQPSKAALDTGPETVQPEGHPARA